MKNQWILLALLIFGLGTIKLWGQPSTGGTSPNPAPAAVSTPEPASSDEKSSDEEENNKPFKPYWENEFQLGFSNQQAGQTSSSLSYTGTQHFDEGGSFLSGELELGSQKVEGATSGTGTLTVNGGLGIGIFTPSLSIGYEAGQSALRQWNGNLSLAFQFWEPFFLTYSIGGNIGNHQGDVSAFYPMLSGLIVQIDTTSLTSSLAAAFVPWDWWTLSLTLEGEYDDTYQLQSIKYPSVKVPVSQTDKIASLTLGLDFTLFKGFTLDLSPEGGQEYYPAGAVYSPLAGGLVVSSTAHTQNFVGGTVSVSYSFE